MLVRMMQDMWKLMINFGVAGFDEYMNLVLDEATEVHTKRKTEKKLGRIMLKGDNITLIQAKEGAA